MEKGRPYLSFLAEQTRGVVEVYYCTAAALQGILNDEETVSAKRLQKAAAEQFEHSSLLGEVDRREAANSVAFGNAVDLLVRQGILTRAEDQPGGDRPRDTEYVRGDAYDDLVGLHERLAGALTAG